MAVAAAPRVELGGSGTQREADFGLAPSEDLPIILFPSNNIQNRLQTFMVAQTVGLQILWED